MFYFCKNSSIAGGDRFYRLSVRTYRHSLSSNFNPPSVDNVFCILTPIDGRLPGHWCDITEPIYWTVIISGLSESV